MVDIILIDLKFWWCIKAWSSGWIDGFDPSYVGFTLKILINVQLRYTFKIC